MTAALERIQRVFREQIHAIDPELNCPEPARVFLPAVTRPLMAAAGDAARPHAQDGSVDPHCLLAALPAPAFATPLRLATGHHDGIRWPIGW